MPKSTKALFAVASVAMLCAGTSAMAQTRPANGASDAFMKSAFCRQNHCTYQGQVNMPGGVIRIYAIPNVELRLHSYPASSEIRGAEYVTSFADTWVHHAPLAASFFSAALETQITAARLQGFAETPPNSYLNLADGTRRFTLTTEITANRG